MTSSAGSSDFLFIPSQYNQKRRAPKNTRSRGSSNATKEHHRKVREARVESWQPDTSGQSQSLCAALPTPTDTRKPSPENSSGEEPWESLHQSLRMISGVTDAGTGQWDPFGSAVDLNLPGYVLQMLEHDASSYLRASLDPTRRQILSIIHDGKCRPMTNMATGVTHQWTVDIPADSTALTRDIKHAILANCRSSEAALYTIVFAAATHYMFGRAGEQPSRRNEMLRYEYKARAITELSKELQTLEGPASEELLMCIITLAAHGDGEQLKPPSLEEMINASPMSKAQDFIYYTRMKFETAHLCAVKRSIIARGGLHTIKMPGLASAIALTDIYIALVRMEAPQFPLLVTTKTVLSYWPAQGTRDGDLMSLGSGFDTLPASVKNTALFQTLDHVRQIILGFDMYLNEPTSAPSLFLIAWARTSIQHDLLALNDRLIADIHCSNKLKGSACHSCIIQHDLEQSLYSLLRWTTMAFVLHVLFPMPRSAGVHTKIAARLTQVLDTCYTNRLSKNFSSLLLWATVIGGATADASQRPLFVERLVRNAAMENLSHMQGSELRKYVESICSQYLWYPVYDLAKEADGFWRDVSNIISAAAQ